MGKHITYIILLFSWSFSYCQNQTIDSLFSVAQTYNTRDSLDINVLSALQKVFNESKESGTNYRMDEICTALGDFFFNYGLYEDGIEYYAYIFTTNIDTTNKSERLINIYRKIGQSYSFLGQPDSAYTYYSHIFNAFSFPERLDVLRDLVEIYANNNDHRKSLEYNQTIEQLLLVNQSPVSELSKVYNNIGYNFHSLKEYENSVDYFEKAISIHPDLPLEEKAVILGNLAISHYNLGDINKSIQLLYEASSMIKDDKQRAEFNHLIASMHQSNNDYFNALEYYQRAGNYAQKAGQIDLLADIYAGFSTVYNQTHEYDLAFEYFKNYSRLTDSLSFVDQLNQKRILDNQKYIARTEKENRLLKAQQDFQKIKIAQLETEAKNQTLRTEALQNDSIQRVNQLELAIQEKEIAEAKERNNALEITRQKNLVELTNQQLVIARANELNAAIEKEKQQKEFELAQEKIVVQERDAQIKEEKNANEAKAREIEKRKVNQRNTAIIAALLALLALFVFWAYRNKRKDNERIVIASDKLKAAEERIKGLLKQQVSGAVAEALITSSDPASVEKRFVGIMFLDIRDFTKFCEGKNPSDIIDYQNSIFGFMIDIIEKHHGVVNQLLGDGFMATFGAPGSHGNDCHNAYMAALEILKTLKTKVEKQEVIPTKVGIGLHAGNVVTGNVGNEERKQYSITGNTVILAARLEQLNKKFGSSLVFSRELYETLPEDERHPVVFESVMVKGRSQPIDVVAL